MRVFLILILSSLTVFGSEKVIHLYKNGTSFITKDFKVDAKEGFYDLEETPNAIFGTLFMGGNSLESFASIKRNKDLKTPITNQKEFLEMQVGSKIDIVLNKGEKFSGKLLSVFDQWITLESDNGYHTLPISEIYTLTTSKKGGFEKISNIEESVLRVFFKTKGEQKFTLKYLTKNLTWIPNYIIEIDSDDSLVGKISPKKQLAKLKMEAMVVNDSENIENSDFNFMIGAPNFKYNNVTSPFVQNQTLEKFLSELSGQNSYQNYNYSRNLRRENFSNAIMSQSMNNDYSEADTTTTDTTFIGSNEGDMYFYTLKNISLKKGERVMLNVIQQDVPFEHIYESNLPSNEVYQNRYNNQTNKGIEVWHSIKLSNLSNMPWTTGSALVIKNGGVPISQDMLYYTSAGKNSFLKISVAPDIIVTQKDIEESIDSKKATLKNGSWYDLVEVKSVLTIQNHKKESISLSLKRFIIGNLKKSDKDWKFEKLFTDNYYGYWGLNSQNSIEWSLTVDSKKTETINYTYSFYRQR
ncbi:hypothetical protein JXR93_13330 [bacterium]|nr:hypothetical protein [bacterium]